MKVLKNYPFDKKELVPEKDQLLITEKHPDWNKAYLSWLAMKNPTEDKNWKYGVFMSYVKE